MRRGWHNVAMPLVTYLIPRSINALGDGPARRAAARARWPELVSLVDAARAHPARVTKIPAGGLLAAYLMIPAADASILSLSDHRVSAEDALINLNALNALDAQPSVTVEGTTVDADAFWASAGVIPGAAGAAALLEALGADGLRSAAHTTATYLIDDITLTPGPTAAALLDAALSELDARSSNLGHWFTALVETRPEVLEYLAPLPAGGLTAIALITDLPVAECRRLVDSVTVSPGAVDTFFSNWPEDSHRHRWVTRGALCLLDRFVPETAAEFLRVFAMGLPRGLPRGVRHNSSSETIELFENLTAPAIHNWIIEQTLELGPGSVRDRSTYQALRCWIPLERLGRVVERDALQAWLQEADTAARRAWLAGASYDEAVRATGLLHGIARTDFFDDAYASLPGLMAGAERHYANFDLLEATMLRVADRLGDNGTAWSLFWRLAINWPGSVADLMTTVQASMTPPV